MPDHPWFLQTYIWQDYDIAPEFPTLMKFLTFWREKLDGSLYSVRIGHSRLIKPAEIENFDAEFRLHQSANKESRPWSAASGHGADGIGSR